MTKKHSETLFSPGKARWLLENAQQLEEGDRALLLALAELSRETGQEFTEEERAALDKLAAGTQGFDPVEIRAAVQQMVDGQATRRPGQDWSGVSRRLKQAKRK
jgi:hypothetical protein